MKAKITSFLSNARMFCKSYVEFCIWSLAFAIGIRFFETILLSNAGNDFTSSIVWNLIGLCYDISLFLRVSVCVLIVFMAGCFINEKTTRIILRIFQGFMLLLSLIAIIFFATSGYLLDNAIFSYTFKEVIFIIRASSKSPVWVYVVMVVLPILYFYLSRKRIKINRILLIAFAFFMISSFFVFNKLSVNTNQYHIKENKAYFFLKSLFENQSFTFKQNDEEIIKAITEFRKYFPELQFVESEYPFLHKNVCKDVLSPFFNLQPEPPNLVFIIVEGLGYEFFKNDYQSMPFVDSLSNQSLWWSNCYSVAPRTFGVMPALLGNLPIGEKGFIELFPYNPEHHSFTRILHENNYTNYFFHGGTPSFLKLDAFSEANNMKYLKENDWDTDIINETIGVKWGYEDHLIYKQGLRKLNDVSATPRMDIYLSQSTHDPFEYPRSSHFQNIVKENVTKNKTLSEQQKKEILNQLSVYGGFLYVDEALRQLIEGYKERVDFENTIFVITGDHHVFSGHFFGYRNYHVPLIIYSPMLKSARKMQGVASHRDIAPTFLSLLQNNYGISVPKEVAWLNTSLDTSSTFNANTFSYLQTGNGACEGIIYGKNFYCNGILEEFTDTVPRVIENPDPTILSKMDRLLYLFKLLDSYALKKDALIRKKNTNDIFSTVILNIEDTIAKGSYFAQRSELNVVEAPEGQKALYFDSTIKFPINFLNHHFSVNDIEKFRINIEFKLYIKEGGIGERLNLVIDLSKNDENIISKSDYLTEATVSQWYDYQYSFVCKKEICEQLGKGCYLKIYLNNQRQEGYIKDIKVQFIVENNTKYKR